MALCHHCGAPAEIQWLRQATDAEATAHWDALERNIRESNSGRPEAAYIIDRTGDAHVPVYGCGDHVAPSACTGHVHEPVPCPVCNAAPGDPCLTPDGTLRPVEHRERDAAQPPIEACTCVHQADCGGYGACQCSTNAASKAQPETKAKP